MKTVTELQTVLGMVYGSSRRNAISAIYGSLGFISYVNMSTLLTAGVCNLVEVNANLGNGYPLSELWIVDLIAISVFALDVALGSSRNN